MKIYFFDCAWQSMGNMIVKSLFFTSKDIEVSNKDGYSNTKKELKINNFLH